MLDSIVQHPYMTFVLGLVAFLVYQFVVKLYILRAKLPPGPFPLPFLGNLLYFRGVQKNFSIIMCDLAKQNGDPTTIFPGPTPVVILSSPETIRENLIANAHDIQSRPPFAHFELVTRGTQDIATAPYNELWKLHKKIAARSMKRIIESDHLSNQIGESVNETVQLMLAEKGPVRLNEYTSSIVYSVLMHFCYGKRMLFGDSLFRERYAALEKFRTSVTANVLALASQPWSTCIFKYCSFIPAIKRVQDAVNDIHRFNDGEVLEHKNNFDPELPTKDIVDAVLMEQFSMQQSGESFERMTDTQLGLLILDVFVAGTDTTSTVLRWFFLEMVLNPEVQSRCQKEIDSAIGTRNPKLADRKLLAYIEACIVETLRKHPPAPLSVPHSASRAGVFLTDTAGKKYSLPENVLVSANIMGMQYNEEYFPNPQKFNPDRFLDSTGTVLKPPTWMPFGCGKRVCLGEQLAKNDMFLIVTGLLQKLKFGKVPGETYDTEMCVDDALPSPRKNYEFTVEERIY